MTRSSAFAVGMSVLCFSACVLAAEQADDSAAAQGPSSAAIADEVVVYKSPSCGCCEHWITHMQRHGFKVAARNVENMNPIKERVGVPHAMGSCHTAEVGGYFIEGHVPAQEVKRLLAEKPKAKGLTVPGMPTGSPGMEYGDRVDPYEVHLVADDGTTTVYASYPKEE
jgi:hypothetical protein